METIVPSLRTYTVPETSKNEVPGTVMKESLVRVIEPDMGKYTCYRHHDKKLMKVELSWGRISTYTHKRETFQVYRHQDGSVCEGSDPSRNDSFVELWALPECKQCGHIGEDTFTYKQEAYGDRTNCNFCDYSSYFSIGD